MNRSGVRNGPERPTLALKWSAHCADAEPRAPLRAFLAVLACDGSTSTSTAPRSGPGR